MSLGGWHKSISPNPRVAADLFMMLTVYLMVTNAVARSGFEPLSKPRNLAPVLVTKVLPVSSGLLRFACAVLLCTMLKRLCQFGLVDSGGGFAAFLDELSMAWGNLLPELVRRKSRRQCEKNPPESP